LEIGPKNPWTFLEIGGFWGGNSVEGRWGGASVGKGINPGERTPTMSSRATKFAEGRKLKPDLAGKKHEKRKNYEGRGRRTSWGEKAGIREDRLVPALLRAPVDRAIGCAREKHHCSKSEGGRKKRFYAAKRLLTGAVGRTGGGKRKGEGDDRMARPDPTMTLARRTCELEPATPAGTRKPERKIERHLRKPGQVEGRGANGERGPR